MVTTRPGGRSARVRAAVHRAVRELLAAGDLDISIGEVAERAGVNPTSIYRRWGSRERLILDTAVAHLRETSPIPDTGSLRDDLLTWTTNVERALATSANHVFLRALLATLPSDEDAGRERSCYLTERLGDIQTMLDRAAARGEQAPTTDAVLDRVLAPLYLRALFGERPASPLARNLVDELLGDGRNQSS